MAFNDFEASRDGGNKIELYLFESTDGLNRWGCTTDSEPYSVGLFTYLPEVISRTEVKQSIGEAPGKITITLPYDHPVAAINVPYLSPNPIRVTVFEVHRDDPAQQLRQAFTGYVSSFRQGAEFAELECSQIIDNVRQNVPWATHKKNCNWALYGPGCYVNKNLYRVVVNDITLVTNDFVQAPTIATKPDGWFTNGFAFHPATGEARFIIAHEGDKLYFNFPFQAVDTSSELETYAGCDRTRQTCRVKFNNILNYLGFDWLPDNNVFRTGVK